MIKRRKEDIKKIVVIKTSFPLPTKTNHLTQVDPSGMQHLSFRSNCQSM